MSTPGLEPGKDRSAVVSRRRTPAPAKRALQKRLEATGYWALLAVLILLVAWFLVAAVRDNGNARDAEATIAATMSAPETAAAEQTAGASE